MAQGKEQKISKVIYLQRQCLRSQIHRQKIGWWMQGTGEGGSDESVFNEDRVSAGEDEKVLETDASDDFMTMEIYLMPQNCTLKTD